MLLDLITDKKTYLHFIHIISLNFSVPAHATANIASLQGVSHGVSQASGSNVRFTNPQMVMQESLRQVVPHTSAQTASAQILANAAEGTCL